MRNAVIRKKALEEQRILRQYIQRPIRFVLGATPGDVIDWANVPRQPLMLRA